MQCSAVIVHCNYVSIVGAILWLSLISNYVNILPLYAIWIYMIVTVVTMISNIIIHAMLIIVTNHKIKMIQIQSIELVILISNSCYRRSSCVADLMATRYRSGWTRGAISHEVTWTQGMACAAGPSGVVHHRRIVKKPINQVVINLLITCILFNKLL